MKTNKKQRGPRRIHAEWCGFTIYGREVTRG